MLLVVFCILQLIPQTNYFHMESLLLPSVYLILPLGSLFITVNSEKPMDPETPKTPSLPSTSTTCACQSQPESSDTDAVSEDTVVVKSRSPKMAPVIAGGLCGRPVGKHVAIKVPTKAIELERSSKDKE
jgi:hypothetical protein